ncbi:MAG: hypothetical protein GY714_08045 [Desulfobacterales bacterium]|nr:hypothetical protein [Desulfobacterales bacterium]
MELLNIKAHSEEMGKREEYENPIDRFLFYCCLELSDNNKFYSLSAQFESGYINDIATWDNKSLDILNSHNIEIDNLKEFLMLAEKKMIELKRSK